MYRRRIERIVKVDKYLEEASGNWLTADNVKVGDRIEVLGAGEIDAETFDKSYLNIPIKLLRTNQGFTFRMGQRNVSRVADTLGKDTQDWVGEQMEIIDIPYYKGLGTKGIMVRGVKEGGKPATEGPVELGTQVLDTIRKSKDIIDQGIPLNESDFNTLSAQVRAKLLKNDFVEKKVIGDVPQYFFNKEKCQDFLR